MDSVFSYLNGSCLFNANLTSSADTLWSAASQAWLIGGGIASQLLAGNWTDASSLLYTEYSRSLESFDEFQLKLLREFSLILAGNSLLVFLAWRIYGPRISSKFMRAGASRRVIEELRTSMSELQLPSEHDFKFK